MKQMAHNGAVRILVVEDEPFVAATLQRGLATEGFDVNITSNSDDGLWMGTEGRYAVLLLPECEDNQRTAAAWQG